MNGPPLHTYIHTYKIFDQCGACSGSPQLILYLCYAHSITLNEVLFIIILHPENAGSIVY